jgi:twitching motility protein PilT
MMSTAAIREYIQDPEKTPLIHQAIQDGVTQYGMQTFDQALMRMVSDGSITVDEAMRASTSPHELSLRLGGIQASSDQSWNNFEQKSQQPKQEKSPF